ncbi:MAG: Peptidase M23 [Parcubacteria group bacterium GW2011_GWF2_46_8]|nr:MAG: Peptidase M23 [Parcubacteria group bacterium GW2011_GWF2_46_8]
MKQPVLGVINGLVAESLPYAILTITTLCTHTKGRKTLLSVVSWLKTRFDRLQNKFISLYTVHWLTKRLPGLCAGCFMVFFAFSVIQAITPAHLYASFPLRNIVMGGPESSSRMLALQSAQYENENQENRVRPYAYSAASGAVYGWPSQNVSVDPLKVNDAEISGESPIVIYDVGQGETIATIAENFRISIDTIVQANSLGTTDITPGQKLIILPVSGVLHEIQQGDTLESLSQYYNVPASRIRTLNGLTDSEELSSGEKIIIPGATAKTKLAFEETTVSEVRFRMPTIGWNWGALHRVNAVDIANRCGTPVYASAAGTVLESVETGWNNGYGIYVLMSHPDKTKTRYAHLSTIFVSVGSSVKQGQLIGAIGKSGKVDGVSGCHLHFEILGATNPFAK